MAGFLGFLGGNYNKPGPGVRKDEPKKPPFIRFWQLFFRKLSKLIQLNLLFLIPVAVIAALIFGIIFLGMGQPLICLIPIILLSPFVAGMTMITRNFVREDHAFVFSDFMDAVKKNWKPFLINGIICYIFTALLYIAIRYYLVMSSKGWMFAIALGVSILIGMLFLFAQYYVPVMIITFDLKLKQIYKNAIIFAIVGLWRNLLLAVIFAVLLFANYVAFYVTSVFTILAMALILLIAFSFISYLINFAVYPLIEKMMIKPYYEKKNQPAEAENKEEKPTAAEAADDAQRGLDSDLPEYVFVDGKLVRKYSDDESVFRDKT